MNDEIKEILEHIQYVIDEDDYWEVTKVTLKPLLDYITNLQQRSVEIGEYNTLVNKYNEIYKENKRLKKQYDNLSEEHELVRCDLHNAWSWEKGTRKELEDYKSRCEKINEILKESPDFNYSNDYIILKRRIEGIIQNGSDDK